MSPSIRPTRWPAWASAAATFAAMVDFPTPPLPLDTAIARPRCGIATGVGGGGTAPGAGRGVAAARVPPGSTTLMRTAVTPCTACAALRASRAREAGSSRVSWNVKVTAPASSTTRSRTIPADTTSWARRGFCTVASAAATRSRRTLGGGAGTGRNVPARPGGGQRPRLLDDDRPVHHLPAEHPVEIGKRPGSVERPAESAGRRRIGTACSVVEGDLMPVGAGPRPGDRAAYADGVLHRREEVVADGDGHGGGRAAARTAAGDPLLWRRGPVTGDERRHKRHPQHDRSHDSLLPRRSLRGRPPPFHAPTVGVVLDAEQAAQRRLLVQPDEQVGNEQE